ncbi:zf-TFIIB domain-containing protein [Polyangium aurulentum]|uniref:TFIIB-type zinc ribbon-containing protein n=1 Tax=Polyangium aurulentum TaxID=2567896 RepID=UPI0010AEDA7F|nr:zf-TFIIB domain-containing protein [Polyangium aurulentum]UQA63073.1 zf-TFIIB domain-containing protein [Polyangium aurulentum]
MDCPRCKLELSKPDPYRSQSMVDDGLTGRVPLYAIAHQAGVEIDRCSACGGVFVHHGELEKIQLQAWKGKADLDYAPPSVVTRAYQRATERAQPGERVPLTCPSCGGEMAEKEWGWGADVTTDVCLECRGVWLDFGELEVLEDYFANL